MTDTGPRTYWTKLRAAGKGDGRDEIASQVSEPETGYGPVRFSLGEDQEPRFLVPCSTMKGSIHEHSTSALSVTKKRLRLRGSQSCFIDLMCTDEALTGVFAELVNEVMSRLEKGQASENAVIGAITDFRALLVSGSAGNASREVILGLLGELLVAERLVQHSPDALKSWLGPEGERHDFRSSVNALEVKTLSRPAASEVSISSVDQLAPLAGGRLVLVIVWLDRAADGGVTVESVVDRILAQGGVRKSVMDALFQLGCPSHRDEDWNSHRFEFGGLQGYDVQPGFPRITTEELPSGALPPGITRLSYRIDLGSAQPYLLSENDLDSFFAEVAK